MYTIPPKKLIIVNILKILSEHSDSEHPLKQKDIQEYLEKEYSMNVGRKAVKRNLMSLMDFGFENIECKITPKYQLNEETGEYEDCSIYSDFYMQHTFENNELKMLIDSIIFSNHIPKSFRDDLIKKLEGLSNKYFKNSTRNIEVFNSVTSQNYQWFMVIEDVNEAINNSRKISFTYNRYNADREMEPECEVTVCPYKMVATNGHYYLICTEDRFDGFNHYRIDRITDLKTLDEHFTPIHIFNLKEYLDSHPYMGTGKAVTVRMKIDEEIIGEVIDAFGEDFRILSDRFANYGKLEIEIKSNVNDMFSWALRFGDCVEILKPQELRDRIRDTVNAMHRKYYRTEEDRYQKAILRAKSRGFLDLFRVDLSGKHIDLPAEDVNSLALFENNTTDFSFIGNYPNLKELYITDNEVSDFSFIGELKSLKSLMIRSTGFNDLSLIKDLPLKRLEISEEHLENTDVLYRMKSLKLLKINRKTADLIDIERLKNDNPELKVCLLREGKELRRWEEI
jgi:predicted DNA-binding transcriptional regulator YafY